MSTIAQNHASETRDVMEEKDLPEGWASAALPECAEIVMGQSPPGSTYNEEKRGLPFFQGKADFGHRFPTARVWCTAPHKIAQPGDILISVRAPVGPTNVANQECAIGRGLAALRPLGNIPTEYILFALRLEEQELSLRGTGSTFTAISRRDLEEVTLNLAPLAEQKRIVAKIEELFDQVNAARARLAKVSQILKRFRQSVLAAAFAGRLTEDWRSQHPGLTPTDLGELPHKSSELAGDAIEGVPEVWRFATVRQLTRMIQYGYTASAKKEAMGPKFLRITDIQNGRVEWNNVPYCSIPTADLPKYQLAAGDIVFARTGATTGKSFLIQSCPKAVFASYLIRVRASEHVLPDFLYNFFQSDLYWKQIAENISGSAQPNCNASKLGSVAVPLPPVSEQHEIVRRVEALLKLADAIEKRVEAATKRAEKLTQAILAKAFRGELVPTEAELARREGRKYESASDLLARIKAERDKSSMTTRSSTRRSRRKGAEIKP